MSKQDLCAIQAYTDNGGYIEVLPSVAVATPWRKPRSSAHIKRLPGSDEQWEWEWRA